MRLRTLPDPDSMPALDRRFALERPAGGLTAGLQHPPRILLLYGSLRDRSYSRLVVEEAARLVRFFGGEPRIFDPSDLPLPDQVAGDDHPAVRELREHAMWSEGETSEPLASPCLHCPCSDSSAESIGAPGMPRAGAASFHAASHSSRPGR